MKKVLKYLSPCLSLALCLQVFVPASVFAQTHVRFTDTRDWTTAELSQYVGQTVIFDQPVYTCNNYSSLTASLHRVMSPTNQCLPLSNEYNALIAVNNRSEFTLSGMTGYHRMGETIYGMKAKINSSTSVTFLACDSIRGTRDDMLRGFPSVDIAKDSTGLCVKHDILVCAANLEYYLVENLGTGYGADNASQLAKQHNKIMQALSAINADIYGFVEVEQGQGALSKLANALTSATGRHFTFINDGGKSNGSYTKSGYVYCSDAVTPFGDMQSNNTGVSNRKKMQAFTHNASGEKFILSLNHFKAKSGTGTGANADQGDGQGSFNADRVKEAQSVISYYSTARGYYNDDDILIMGDLNAYAKEDPVQALVKGGMTDLHRHFHDDASYSYTYRGQAGYLDHALCNKTMLGQITGIAVWHVNSDEHDRYTYDKQDDETMFRYSDHDPVIVGIKLGAALSLTPAEGSEAQVVRENGRFVIKGAEGGWFVICSPFGQQMTEGKIDSNDFAAGGGLPQGLYIINVYANGTVTRTKFYLF